MARRIVDLCDLGALHGGMLMAERALGKESFYDRLPRPCRVALTFLIVLIGWVFFRASDLRTAVKYLANMVGLGAQHEGALLIGGVIYQPYYLVVAGLAAVVVWGSPDTWEWTRTISWSRALTCVALGILAVVVMVTQTYNPFIYFMF